MSDSRLTLPRETVEAWLKDPISSLVFKMFASRKTEYIYALAQMPVQSMGVEKIAIETARLRGIIDAYDEILSLGDPEDGEID